MLSLMKALPKILAGVFIIAAVSSIIYARMSHNPPILWGGIFAVCVGAAIVGSLWYFGQEDDEDN